MRKSGKYSYFIALFAGLIRYYDYALFGLSASSIASNFMPASHPADRLLNFFFIFSLSLAARPLGAIVFGRISDRVGRAASVKITSIIASGSVMTVAFLPSYDMIGISATILLTLCRMIFIMSLGGEVDAIKIYLSEKVGKERRYTAGGLISFAAQAGVLIAAFMYDFTLSFEKINWLWRINFIIGGSFGVVVFLLRNYLEESIVYRDRIKDKKCYPSPSITIKEDRLLDILIYNKRKFFSALILQGGVGASYNFWVIFIGAFFSDIGGFINKAEASKNNIILITVYAFSALSSGVLADIFSVNKSKKYWADEDKYIFMQILISLILTLILTFVTQFFDNRHEFSFILSLCAVFLIPIYAIPLQIKLQSLFPKEIRVRMCGLTHSLGSMIFSGTVPFFSMLIWQYTQIISFIYLYFMLLLFLMIGAIIYLKKKSYQNMFEDSK